MTEPRLTAGEWSELADLAGAISYLMGERARVESYEDSDYWEKQAAPLRQKYARLLNQHAEGAGDVAPHPA